MEIGHFRHFVAVAEELHFARAAARLGIEQSPLSHSIRNLEAELGVKLFHRSSRQTWLTRTGTKFYQDVTRILSEIDSATAAVRQHELAPDAIRLALGGDLAGGPFTRFLSELAHQSPKVQIDVRELQRSDAVRLVRSGDADLALTLDGRSEPELELVQGWAETLMIVAPLGHPYGEREAVSLCELSDQCLALPTATECPGYLAQIEALLAQHGVQPVARRNVRYWNTALSFAAIGRSLALCPVSMVCGATTMAVVAVAEKEARLITWLLHRDEKPSPAVDLALGIAAQIAAGGQTDLPSDHAALGAYR